MVETGIQGEVFLYSFAIFFYVELYIFSIKIIHKFVSSCIKCVVIRGGLFKIIDYVILDRWI